MDKSSVLSTSSLNASVASAPAFSAITPSTASSIELVLKNVLNSLGVGSTATLNAILDNQTSSLSSTFDSDDVVTLSYNNTEFRLKDDSDLVTQSNKAALVAAYSYIKDPKLVVDTMNSTEPHGALLFPSLISASDAFTAAEKNPSAYGLPSLTSSTLPSRLATDRQGQVWMVLPPGHSSGHALALVDIQSMHTYAKQQNSEPHPTYFTYFFDLSLDGTTLTSCSFDTIVLNKTATYALLSSSTSSSASSILVVRLPEPNVDLNVVMRTYQQRAYLSSGNVNVMTCPAVAITPPSTPSSTKTSSSLPTPSSSSPSSPHIIQASFHPLSASHVTILTSTSQFLLYNVAENWLIPEQVYALNTLPIITASSLASTLDDNNDENSQPLSPTTTFPSRSPSSSFLPLTYGKSSHTTTTPASDATMPSRRLDFVSFAFGPMTIPYSWDVFSIFFLTSSGTIATLAPIVPHGAILPVKSLVELRTRTCALAFTSSHTLYAPESHVALLAPPTDAAVAVRWLDSVFDLIPVASDDTDAVEGEEMFHTVPRSVVAPGQVAASVIRVMAQQDTTEEKTTRVALLLIRPSSESGKTGTSANSGKQRDSESSLSRSAEVVYSHLTVVPSSVPLMLRRVGLSTSATTTFTTKAAASRGTHLIIDTIVHPIPGVPTANPQLASSLISNIQRMRRRAATNYQAFLASHADTLHSPDVLTSGLSSLALVPSTAIFPATGPPTHSAVIVSTASVAVPWPKLYSSASVWNALSQQTTLTTTATVSALLAANGGAGDGTGASIAALTRTGVVGGVDSLAPSFSFFRPGAASASATTSTSTSTSTSVATPLFSENDVSAVSSLVSAFLLSLRRAQRRQTRVQLRVMDGMTTSSMSIAFQTTTPSLASLCSKYMLDRFIAQHTARIGFHSARTRRSLSLFLAVLALILSRPIAAASVQNYEYNVQDTASTSLSRAYVDRFVDYANDAITYEEEDFPEFSAENTLPTNVNIWVLSADIISDTVHDVVSHSTLATDLRPISSLVTDVPLAVYADVSATTQRLSRLPAPLAVSLTGMVISSSPLTSSVLLALTPMSIRSFTALHTHPTAFPTSPSASASATGAGAGASGEADAEDEEGVQWNVVLSPEFQSIKDKYAATLAPTSTSTSTSASTTTLGKPKSDLMSLDEFIAKYRGDGDSLTPLEALRLRLSQLNVNKSLASVDCVAEVVEYKKRLHGILLHCHAAHVQITSSIDSIQHATVQQAQQLAYVREMASALKGHIAAAEAKVELMTEVQSLLERKLAYLRERVQSALLGPSEAEREYHATLAQVKRDAAVMQSKVHECVQLRADVQALEEEVGDAAGATAHGADDGSEEGTGVEHAVEEKEEEVDAIYERFSAVMDRVMIVKEHLRLRAAGLENV